VKRRRRPRLNVKPKKPLPEPRKSAAKRSDVCVKTSFWLPNRTPAVTAFSDYLFVYQTDAG
jgi:hypothetical protein